VVTVTLTDVPAVPAGAREVKVIVLAVAFELLIMPEVTATELLPNPTDVAPVKLVPVITSVVPPAAGPELGLTLATVGGGGRTKVNLSELVGA
jgi:hypothetical protein